MIPQGLGQGLGGKVVKLPEFSDEFLDEVVAKAFTRAIEDNRLRRERRRDEMAEMIAAVKVPNGKP